MRRFLLTVAMAGGTWLAVACDGSPAAPSDASDPPIPLPSLFVSDVAPASLNGTHSNFGLQQVTWVSLPPGSLTGFVSVRIRNLTLGGPATSAIGIIAGGFDPVAVVARESDELELAFSELDGTVHRTRLAVPGRRPPSILRTSPPKGRTDVALDARPAVVFTEPLDAATLTSENVRLVTGGTPVSGSIRQPPDQPWVVEFVPAAPLRPATEYLLEIADRVRDVQGDPLGEAFSVTFTTTADAFLPAFVDVSNSTHGGAFDPDGYELIIDGGILESFMELNESVQVVLSEGMHTIELSGVSANCLVAGSAERSVSVVGGTSTALGFDVSCTPPPELASIRIAFEHGALGRPTLVGASIVAMNADGSDRVQLTSGAYLDYGPDVSPDGSRIAFVRHTLDARWLLNPEIVVMNSDGTGVTSVRSPPAFEPDWSPDGSRILFLAGTGIWGGWVHVMQADGSNETALTEPGEFPGPEQGWAVWSPDGTRIAYTQVEFIVSGQILSIWVMNTDGSGAIQLTPPGISNAWGPFGPVWSPDGSVIAFTMGAPDGSSTLVVMRADGSGLETVRQDPDWLLVHDWSADGRYLLLSKTVRGGSPGRQDVFLLRLEDGAMTRLTADVARNGTPAFWPVPGT